MEKKWVYLLIGLVLLFFLGTIFSPSVFENSLNPETIKGNVAKSGFWAPAVLIFMIVAACIFSVVPMPPFIIAAGYVLGIFYGTLYSLVGLVIGMSIVFGLTKKFGRPFAEKLADKKKIKKFDAFFHKWGVWALVIQRLIPFYPVNIMGFSMGLTKMKYKTFISIYTLLTFPGLIFQTGLGSLTSYSGLSLKSILLIAAVLLLIVLIAALFSKDKIKKWVLKEIEVLEKDFKKGKKK